MIWGILRRPLTIIDSELSFPGGSPAGPRLRGALFRACFIHLWNPGKHWFRELSAHSLHAHRIKVLFDSGCSEP